MILTAPWLLWTLLALLCWGIWAILTRLIGDSVSPELSQALSTFGILPVLLGILFLPGFKGGPDRKKGAALAFVAGLLTCAGNVSYYKVLSSGAKAATVVPLTALYPLITVLLAVAWLKEKLNRIQMFGIMLAGAAIYFFNIQTESGMLNGWLAAAFVPVAFWGIAGLLQKVATNHVSGEFSTTWFLLSFLPVSALLLITGPSVPQMSGRTWGLILLLGFSFALGNFALLQAFARDGKASVITPLAGLYPVVSIPIAVVGLHEKIALREAVGILLALASVAAISLESPPSAQISKSNTESK